MFSMKLIQRKVERKDNFKKQSSFHSAKPITKKKRKRGVPDVVQQLTGTTDGPNPEESNSCKKAKMEKTAKGVNPLGVNGTQCSDSTVSPTSEVPVSQYMKTRKKKPGGSTSVNFKTKKKKLEVSTKVNEKAKKNKSKVPTPLNETKGEEHEILATVNRVKRKKKSKVLAPANVNKEDESEVSTSGNKKKKKKARVPTSVNGKKEEESKVSTSVNKKKKTKAKVPTSVDGKKEEESEVSTSVTLKKKKKAKVPTSVDGKKEEESEVSTSVTLKKKKKAKVPISVNGKKEEETSTMSASGKEKTKKKFEVSVSVKKKTKNGKVVPGVSVSTFKKKCGKKLSKKNKTKKVRESCVVGSVEGSSLREENYFEESYQADTHLDFLDGWEEPYSCEVGNNNEEQKMSQSYEETWVTGLENKQEDALLEYQDSYVRQEGSDDMSVFAQDEKFPNRSENGKLFSKRGPIGKVVGVTVTKRETLVAALTPGSTIYIKGVVQVCPLVGTVKILGYTLKEGEVQSIYSVTSAALLDINVVSAHNIDPTDSRLQDKEIPTSWLQNIITEEPGPLLILEIQRQNPPVARFLSQAGWQRLLESKEKQEFWYNVRATLITESNCKHYKLFRANPSWHEFIDIIKTWWTCGSVPRVVVCGGKDVGKSTLFKYIANTLLSSGSDSGIMCLDLDPGQSEFTLPACVSLARLTKPLLGPAYTHNISKDAPYFKQVLVGATSPQFMLQRYMAAVQYLHKISQKQPSVPLLVNTMGWTRGTGVSIMLDVLRIINPTHVIQLQSGCRDRNYPAELNSNYVVNSKRGIVNEGKKYELYYSLFVLPSTVRKKDTPHSFTPKILRELAIASHVSQFVVQQLQQIQNKTSSLVKLSWTSVVVHICSHQVPREHTLQVINAQLVALSWVSPDNIETVDPNLPKQLTTDSDFGELVGWGIISGIDSLTRELTILTSLQPQSITTQVNAIIMPELHLPDCIYKLFSSGEGPYLQFGNRKGAARLKVNRQIKPSKRRRNRF
ncbi:polynucleotide 5'-hydroxyl-kinase NOL9-like [Homarus americanus]|uniref:Polynucleotide 5'-hydroxyl-kinase NOL9-like n=1 Tax=Homarus americanus TaxID=6706 RepID=A0A8J5K9Q8_HOMAM|nr:polynucleotide 5'-hydroxyl-kinase NOL9-like [Homarus americanus]XP_042220447.1 polynucleotide 5'-hydroxyl-kinase NOL9-like [Homarus americanus]XP_042220448.1 polynucleotide 5'-hydroxyl-kinase NOL9-like [Homarus americanus]XP_042220449.1 polynucleotide 5'-hydroxyl-kinase NOL9-like [Homarus americanus]KAG7169908.1 Polynucleotide 5'-hydroxyl-kinase NOL9-like [Homarus americanus]